MPVKKCANGKWRIGSGECQYDTKKSAESAYEGYRASKYSQEKADGGVVKAFSPIARSQRFSGIY